jgi:hypothetical protein
VTALGQGLKFETDEPHFITLGGGRLGVGVTMCPVKLGMQNYTVFVLLLSRHITFFKAWFPYGRNGRKNRVTIFLLL